MPKIKRRYIVNDRQEPVEVILDLATFERMEQLVEDQLFGAILQETAREQPITIEEARRRHTRMKKLSNKSRG
jgi:hypothetical protein